jgi:hypothetical protein
MISGERENVVAFGSEKSNEPNVEYDHSEQRGKKCWILDESGDSSRQKVNL